jgi:hypothetical protein
MSLILHILISYQIAHENILIVDDIIILSYVGLKKMSISTAKDYIDIFAKIFNFYQSKFSEDDSKIDITLLGVEEEFFVADFFPDIQTKTDVSPGINSTDFFYSSTANEISFENYGLITTKKGGKIYFESPDSIIENVVTLLGVFTRKAFSAHLLLPSDLNFKNGKRTIDKKVVFKYGKLFDASKIVEEHLIVTNRRVKKESQHTEVQNLMLFLYVS